MRRILGFLVLWLILCCPAQAQEELKPSILVLPIQGAPSWTGVGLANLLENLLATHPVLDEQWVLWDWSALFPHDAALRTYLNGGAAPPAKSRYVMKGRLQGSLVLTLEDRSTGKTAQVEAPLDYPKLLGFQGQVKRLLTELELAQLPDSALWNEDLDATSIEVLGQGLAAYYREDWKTAEATLARLARTRPGSYLAQNAYGWALFKTKQSEKAEKQFLAAMELYPGAVDSADGLDSVYAELGNFPTSETWIRRKAANRGRDSREAEWHLNRARAMRVLDKDQYSAAIPLLQAALEFRPRDASMASLLALCYRKTSQFEEAYRVLKQARDLGLRSSLLDRVEAGVNGARAYKLSRQKRWKEAIELYRLAIPPSRPQEAGEFLSGLGEAYLETEQPELAMEALHKALELLAKGKDRSEQILARGRLARALRALHRDQEALTVLQQMLKDSSSLSPQARLLSLVLAGKQLRYLKRYNEAVPLWEEAVAVAESLKDPDALRGTLRDLAITCMVDHRFASGIGYMRRALQLDRTRNDVDNMFWDLTFIAQAQLQLQDFGASLQASEQALQLQAPNGSLYSAHAKALEGLRRYAEAVESQQKAVAAFERESDPDSVFQALTRLAVMARLGGKLKIWSDTSERMVAVSRDSESRATSYTQLGYCQGRLGQSKASLDSYDKAIGYARETKNVTLEVNLLKYRAEAQAEPDATQSLRDALALAKTTKDSSLIAIAMGQLGDHLNNQENDKEGLPLMQAASALLQPDDIERRGRLLFLIGRAYYREGENAKALDSLQQSWALSSQDDDAEETFTRYVMLMRVWAALDKPRLAIFFGKQAIALHQSLRSSMEGLAQDTQDNFLKNAEQRYRLLASLLVGQGRLDEAQQVLGLLKNEEYKQFTRSDTTPNKPVALSPDEVAWQAESSRVSQQLASIASERGRLRQVQNKTPAEEARLVQLDHDLDTAGKVFRQFQEKLGQELSKNRPDKIRELKESTALMSDLRELGQGTVIIYTLVGEKAVSLILLTPDFKKAYQVPIPEKDLNGLVFGFRRALVRPDSDVVPASQALYRVLLAPLAADLQKAGAKNLMWSLDGVLRFVPLAALHDGQSYMVEKYRQVIFTPASQARLKDVPHPAQWKILGLGVSKEVGGFSALPAVPEEMRGLASLFPTVTRMDEAFTRKSFREELGKGYPVVHIASHFNFSPGSNSDSFLLMGDGSRLNLAQLEELNNVFEGVELLTLSACSTAAGDARSNGKEVEGLAVLAQQQGAKAVVATLWNVADGSTGLLMEEFYRLQKAGQDNKAENLRLAQLKLLHSDAWRHPYFWAPFLLLGNWK